MQIGDLKRKDLVGWVNDDGVPTIEDDFISCLSLFLLLLLDVSATPNHIGLPLCRESLGYCQAIDRFRNMKTTGVSGFLTGVLFTALSVEALPAVDKRDVDTRFPYTGPKVPIADVC